MATVIEGKNDAETIELIRLATGVDEVTARFIMGQERGEITSDVIVEPEPAPPKPAD